LLLLVDKPRWCGVGTYSSSQSHPCDSRSDPYAPCATNARAGHGEKIRIERVASHLCRVHGSRSRHTTNFGATYLNTGRYAREDVAQPPNWVDVVLTRTSSVDLLHVGPESRARRVMSNSRGAGSIFRPPQRSKRCGGPSRVWP